MMSYLFVAVLALLPFSSLGCKPSLLTSTSYSTTEKIASSKTVFVVDFKATCVSGSGQVPSLFASVGDKFVPVVRSLDDSIFQVSWADEHKKASSGTYVINFYTEEAYATLRRAQRQGTTDANAKAAFSLSVQHPGASQAGLWLQTEFIALVSALLIWWFANNLKNKLSA